MFLGALSGLHDRGHRRPPHARSRPSSSSGGAATVHPRAGHPHPPARSTRTGSRDATAALIDRPARRRRALAPRSACAAGSPAAESLGLDDDLLDALGRCRGDRPWPQGGRRGAHRSVSRSTWQTPGATYAEVLDHLAGPVRPAPRRSTRPCRGAARRRRDRRAARPRSPTSASTSSPCPSTTGTCPTTWPRPSGSCRGRRRHGRRRHLHLGPRRRPTSPPSPSGSAVVDRGAAARARPAAWRSSCVGPGDRARGPRRSGSAARSSRANARLGAMVQALVVELRRPGRRSVDLDGMPLLIQGRLVIGRRRRADPPHRPGAGGARASSPDAPGRRRLEAGAARRVWTGESDDHVVEVTVGRLRRRLGPAGDSIETVMRRGYRLARLTMTTGQRLHTVDRRVRPPHSADRSSCGSRARGVTPGTRVGNPASSR